MKRQLTHSFGDIVSVESLYAAWNEFVRGKRKKPDVMIFSSRLMDNILSLYGDLTAGRYRHGGYESFHITDPKPRHIHKASVRDRLVHHAIYRVVYPFFDKTFIADSYSCRIGKGTHKALDRFRFFARQVSHNNTRTCWALQGDIRKFFASIDQSALMRILDSYIPDKRIVQLLHEVTGSFSVAPNIGLPLGNLTSQLFVNVYMNEFDQFVKHSLRIKYYIRYADDFAILSYDRNLLEAYLPLVREFLRDFLKLTLHPNKVSIRTIASGIDFLGWVHFPHHRVLRTTTKRRMLNRIVNHPTNETVQSYLGLLKHGDSYEIQREVLILAGLWYSRFSRVAR